MKNSKLSILKVLIATLGIGISLLGCISQDYANLNEVATPSTAVLPRKTCPPKTTASVQIGTHIGLRMPSELTGFERTDSFLFFGIDDYSHQMSHVVENQGQHYFWLERICDDENGTEQSEVIDEIILPPLEDSEFASTSCLIVGEINILTAAIGSYETGITRAWTLDNKRWKFEEVPADRLADIACH